MDPQQQNPHAFSNSQPQKQQEMGSKEINSAGEADVKPFSIREFVLASRQRDIHQNWPFPEKYLQMCLDRGVKNVLPPFDELNKNNSVSESSSQKNVDGFSNLKSSDQDNIDDNKDLKVFKSEAPDHPVEQKQQNIIEKSDEKGSTFVDKSSQIMNCSSKTSKDKRKRSRKGRCKKKSMAEILQVAKHCSSEEIDRINQFSYAGAEINNNEEDFHNQTANPDENTSKFELTNNKSSYKKDE